MKRIRDDVYASGSHFRRPRGELYGQSPVPATGTTEEGGGGEGGRIAVGEINSQKLTTNDALSYLREVKEMFQDQREKYDRFLQVMKDFKAQWTDTGGVIARVKELFKGHNHLIYGFNTFLPKGYEITLIEEDEALPKKTVEFEEAINFVNKIKKRFKHDEHVYKSFLDILNMYRKENKEINEVYNEVSILFEGHLDLLEEFTRFLPASLPSHSAAQHSRSQAQRYNDRGSGPLIRQMQVEKERRRERAVASRGDYSVERYDHNDDKTMVKMQREQRKRVDKEHRARRGRDLDEEREAEQDNLQNFPEKRKSSRRAEGLEAYSGSASHPEKDNLKSMHNQAFVFCEKVKERLCSQDDYQTFLKCLNIFSNGIIQRKDLQNLVSDLLGKFPDLMDEFNQFFERCESIDGFQHLAGVMSKKSFSSEEQLSRPMKVEQKEREHKPDLEAVKETEQHKEEYMGKSIQELDLSDCECCTPSYRLLPADYPVPTASQKSELGAEVLNDHWVSVTSGSEDYSFKHMRRNQYEESLFRCEDDRFELDMLLESVRSAARSAENLLNIITEKKISFSGSFRIEDHFTALNLRCIERLYGDHGLDVIDILHKSPATALPVILTRLKQKQDEWKKCREDFDKVWANVYAKNHYKSLDHRSFYFKQQDSKNLSAKSLVAEIKELKEKSQNEDDVLLSISAGYRQPTNPNLEYEYSNRAIHEDLYKLVQFSCEELCSTKEQFSKVLRLWENFLEAVLGVPPRAKGKDPVEDVVIKPKTLDVNHSKSINEEAAAVSSGADTAKLASRKLKSAVNGDENTSSEASKHGGIGLLNKDFTGKENLKDPDTANGDGVTCPAVKPQKELETENGVDKRFGMPIPMDICERAATSSLSIPSGGENNHGVVGKDDSAGSHEIQAKPSNTLIDIHHRVDSIETVHPTQGDDVGNSTVLANGLRSESSKGIRNSDEPEGPSSVEKEEGELSPNGDFEDNFAVYEDIGVKPTSKQENSADAEVEDEDDGGDDDSENASESGEDASGSESGGDECSQDENREEEDGEHDEIDGKGESEGEAEGMDSHLLEGDSELLPQSERVFLSIRPLSKHVAAVLRDERTKDFRVFYGNDDFYVLFRLHQILYDRILSAKRNCSGGELKSKNSKDTNSLDPYARFMRVLYGLLDGSAENTKFEDECRAIIGNQSYVLFTLDKLIYKLVKQLQAIVADEMDNKLLQLYEYEKSRKPGNIIDSVYYENTKVLLHEENIYRLECSSSPSRLSIQLMDNVIEKPEAYAVSMDPTFASYMQTEFLSTSSGKKEEGHDIVLQRNLRPYTGLDDLAALCKTMEGVEVVNGLECKMSCSSHKISYYADYKMRFRDVQSGEQTHKKNDGEHDEIDGKGESEGEAEGMDSHLLEGDSELLPQSERVFLSIRPLSKHVAAVLRDERTKDFRVFYGNDDFYVLFRLHQILYDRILSAKRNCSGGELKSKNSKDTNSLDPYARFMRVLYGLLDGSAENTKFEDECRAIIGNQSYVLFTLDKLIYKLVKQLQAIVADEMDNKLLQLYEYEKSRKPGNIIDSVYYENTKVLLHEENIYRLECSSSPSRLSIQLMDNVIEKPEAYAVSMDPTFASYMQTEFLSTSSGKKEEGHDIVLQRNLRPYTGLDDLAALCKTMEGVEVVNGLECKMSCSSHKISYVLDTEDFFHRKKKKKKTEQLSQRNKERVERFHRFLSTSR